MTIEHQPFVAATLVRDLAVIGSASIGAKPIRLLFDLDPRLPARLVGDALRLQQVLVNLLGNAIKFTEAGEVVLEVAVVERKTRSAVLEFAVRDSGIGIAAEMHERIFGGFTQAEASTTRRFGGTGLGLTISQRLVTLMGGELGLESAPGAGSRFHFRVELDAGDDASSDVVGHAAAPIRMLLVDEHASARQVVSRTARTLGWRVDVAASGAAAHEAMRSRGRGDGARVDGVVLSAALALHESGVEGAGGEAHTADSPLRFVVGSQTDRDRLARAGRTEGAGFDAYLVEPVTPAALRAAFDRPRRVDAGAPALAPPAASRDLAASPSSSKAPSSTRLASLRVLLVEDNVHNQQVARELLEDEGASVRIASDGQQAVDLLVPAADVYDIVLMDLQMPVMDGFTAARHIRAALGPALPIVAMTANATDADRDACAAAGMNDHVGKPFDLDALVACLLRHVGRAESAEARAASIASTLPSGIVAAATAGGIDVDAALIRLGGHRPAYRRLLESVVTQLAKTSSDGPEIDDREATLRRAHTLKGLAATLGATALSASVGAVEARLRDDGERADVAVAIADMRRAIDAARPGLDALLHAWPASPRIDAVTTRVPLDDTALRAGLERIARHLRHADMAALDAMDELHERASGSMPELDALRGAIARLDFERALALCDDLISAAATPA